MKTIIKYSLFIIAAINIIACDPIENRDSLEGAITADDLDISATEVVVDGVNSNKIVLENRSPVLSWWDYGIGVSQKQSDTVLMVVTGSSNISFTGLNPDGSKISKELSVTVDSLVFDVAPEWGYFCGEGERSWSWDETASICFGNGGYLGNSVPTWWGLPAESMDGQAPGQGLGATMVFSTSGATLTKNLTDGSSTTGTFAFEMNDITYDGEGNVWSKGKLRTSGVSILCGISPNEGRVEVYEFDIIELNDEMMVLSYHINGISAWGEAWFWVFRSCEDKN